MIPFQNVYSPLIIMGHLIFTQRQSTAINFRNKLRLFFVVIQLNFNVKQQQRTIWEVSFRQSSQYTNLEYESKQSFSLKLPSFSPNIAKIGLQKVSPKWKTHYFFFIIGISREPGGAKQLSQISHSPDFRKPCNRDRIQIQVLHELTFKTSLLKF